MMNAKRMIMDAQRIAMDAQLMKKHMKMDAKHMKMQMKMDAKRTMMQMKIDAKRTKMQMKMDAKRTKIQMKMNAKRTKRQMKMDAKRMRTMGSDRMSPYDRMDRPGTFGRVRFEGDCGCGNSGERGYRGNNSERGCGRSTVDCGYGSESCERGFGAGSEPGGTFRNVQSERYISFSNVRGNVTYDTNFNSVDFISENCNIIGSVIYGSNIQIFGG